MKRRIRHAAQRGLSLIEVLVTVAIAAALMGIIVLGSGTASSARLKRSAVMVTGAAKIAFSVAASTCISVRSQPRCR